MIISVLISLLLQLGIIYNVSDFNESKTQEYQEYIEEVNVNANIIVENDTFI